MVSDQPAATGNVGQLMPTGIEVEHLTERYGDNVAVADVSFAVGEGEICGILGRNGRRISVLGLEPRRH